MFHNMYINIFASIFFLLLVGSNGCVNDNQKIIPDGRKNLSNSEKKTLEKQIKNTAVLVTQDETVSMRLADVSSEKAIIELSNNTKNTVYLAYSGWNSNESVNAEVYGYSFNCKQKGKKEVLYNRYDSHILPSLEPLETGKSFRFEVSPLPKINAKCKVSVLYYDDKQIVDLLDNETLDFSDEDYKNIEKAKKFTNDVQFDINNKFLNKNN